jgi:hypothetical protein
MHSGDWAKCEKEELKKLRELAEDSSSELGVPAELERRRFIRGNL